MSIDAGTPAPRDVCRTGTGTGTGTGIGAAAPVPVRLVAGTHSGRNAAYLAATLGMTPGRALWLVGPLQRALAQSALAAIDRGSDAWGPGAVAAGRAARQAEPRPGERLEIEGLSGGCACCTAGTALGAGLTRLLGKRHRTGTGPEAMAIQLEPEGDAAMLADRLRESPCDLLVRVEAIVAVLSVDELALLGAAQGAGGPRPLRSVAAADRVVVAPADGGLPDVSAAATALGPGWRGGLRSWHEAKDDGPSTLGEQPDLPPGWSGFAHDPFGHSAGEPPWRLVARWPGAVRFDRRRIAAWLADIGVVAGVGGVAFIGRTERQWLGWRPDAIEVPLAWRVDSRLAIRLAQDAEMPATAGSAAATVASVRELGKAAPRLDAAATTWR